MRFTEILFDALFDDEYDLVKARALCVVYRIVKKHLSVLSDRLKLFQPAEAASHSRRHNYKCCFFHIVSCLSPDAGENVIFCFSPFPP